MHRRPLAFPAECHPIHPSSLAFPTIGLLHASLATSLTLLSMCGGSTSASFDAYLVSSFLHLTCLVQRMLWTAVRGSGWGDFMTSYFLMRCGWTRSMAQQHPWGQHGRTWAPRQRFPKAQAAGTTDELACTKNLRNWKVRGIELCSRADSPNAYQHDPDFSTSFRHKIVIRANRESILPWYFLRCMGGRPCTNVQMQESRLCQNDLQEFGQTFPACWVSKQRFDFWTRWIYFFLIFF